jgi:hypothetical protein
MRSRRDHERFIDLIACVCFLRQYQKETKTGKGTEYIECDLEDYRLAYRIMKGILPSTLANFPKAALSLYEAIRQVVRKKAEREKLASEDVALTQRELREATGLGHMVIKRNLRVLSDYEYLVSAGGKQRGTRKAYRLVRDQELQLVDLSMIPSPEEMEVRIHYIQSGSGGSDQVKVGQTHYSGAKS